MSLMVKDKQLFENYNNIWEKTEKSKTDSKHFHGYDDNSKYIKAKTKTFKAALLQIFMIKRA